MLYPSRVDCVEEENAIAEPAPAGGHGLQIICHVLGFSVAEVAA
jgi:hypothetical protein